QGRDVDDLAGPGTVPDHQIEIVRPRGALLVERPPAIGRVTLNEAKARRELGDVAAQFGERLDGIENGAGVGTFSLHPLDRVRLLRLHVAVSVSHLASPEGLGDRLDGRARGFGEGTDGCKWITRRRRPGQRAAQYHDPR